MVLEIKKILNQANLHLGKKPSQEFIDALNATNDLSPEQRAEVRLSVAQSLSKIDSASGAGFIGIWLGGSVENGASPEPYIPYLLDHLIVLMNQLQIIEGNIDESPENNEILTGLEYLGQSLVSHVARSKKYHEKITSDTKIMNQIEEFSDYSTGVNWLYELLSKYSSDLIVLHAEQKIGVRVHYKNLSNCFHLFTLLQKALVDIMPHDDNNADADSTDQDEDFFNHAWWHYGQANIPKADIMGSIWGEMSPRSISIIDNEQILILWPKIMLSRDWDDGFFHPLLEAAPAGLEILNILTKDEVLKWHKCLQLTQGETDEVP